METMARQHSDAQAEILIWALCHVYICNQSLHAGWLVLDSRNNALRIQGFGRSQTTMRCISPLLWKACGSGLGVPLKYRLIIRVPFSCRATRELSRAISCLDSCMAWEDTSILTPIILLIQKGSLLADRSTSLLSPFSPKETYIWKQREKKDVQNRRKTLFWHLSGSNGVPKAKQMHVSESDNFTECRTHPFNLPWSTALHGPAWHQHWPFPQSTSRYSHEKPFLSLQSTCVI